MSWSLVLRERHAKKRLRQSIRHSQENAHFRPSNGTHVDPEGEVKDVTVLKGHPFAG